MCIVINYHHVSVRNKFGLSDGLVQFVLESDGTLLDDYEFDVMKHLADQNSIMLVLKEGEQWSSTKAV